MYNKNNDNDNFNKSNITLIKICHFNMLWNLLYL